MAYITENGDHLEFDTDLIGGGTVHAVYDPEADTIVTTIVAGHGDAAFLDMFGQLVDIFDADNEEDDW